MNKDKPIGIFDSGIGGLTVLKELRRVLPDEQLIYFGDTARIPYGTKSAALVTQYALEDAAFLMQYKVKLIVVACNTASALAIDTLQKELPVPVVGVVLPGALAALRESRSGKIGVIGTTATINSKAYKKTIVEKAAGRDVLVDQQACPLLVPLVEEGWLEDDITDLTLKRYLGDLLNIPVDTLVLGCTHYPLLKPAIRKLAGEQVALIDSGHETAVYVKEALQQHDLLHKGPRLADDYFFVSDIPQKFAEIGSRFLGEKLSSVQRVDFEQFLVQHSAAPGPSF